MAEYRKKPVVIEAFRFDEDEVWPEWAAKAERSGQVVVRQGAGLGLDIKTLEGTMRAERGDWIIKGIKGELYPCKPDIFAATYEPAGDELANESATAAEQCMDAIEAVDAILRALPDVSPATKIAMTAQIVLANLYNILSR